MSSCHSVTIEAKAERMQMASGISDFALPFPTGIKMSVFKDDGQWDQYRAWFMRSHADLQRLIVAKITLGHWEDTEEPAYTAEEWRVKSEKLLKDFPDCVFVYA